MEPVACPGVTDAKRFQNDEWLAELGCMGRGVLECEVPPRPAKANHPIDDMGAVRSEWQVVEGANPVGGSGDHDTATQSEKVWCEAIRSAVRTPPSATARVLCPSSTESPTR